MYDHIDDNSDSEENNSTHSADLQIEGINDHRMEEDRLTEAEKNERVKKQLKVRNGKTSVNYSDIITGTPNGTFPKSFRVIFCIHLVKGLEKAFEKGMQKTNSKLIGKEISKLKLLLAFQQVCNIRYQSLLSLI